MNKKIVECKPLSIYKTSADKDVSATDLLLRVNPDHLFVSGKHAETIQIQIENNKIAILQDLTVALQTYLKESPHIKIGTYHFLVHYVFSFDQTTNGYRVNALYKNFSPTFDVLYSSNSDLIEDINSNESLLKKFILAFEIRELFFIEVTVSKQGTIKIKLHFSDNRPDMDTVQLPLCLSGVYQRGAKKKLTINIPSPVVNVMAERSNLPAIGAKSYNIPIFKMPMYIREKLAQLVYLQELFRKTFLFEFGKYPNINPSKFNKSILDWWNKLWGESSTGVDKLVGFGHGRGMETILPYHENGALEIPAEVAALHIANASKIARLFAARIKYSTSRIVQTWDGVQKNLLEVLGAKRYGQIHDFYFEEKLDIILFFFRITRTHTEILPKFVEELLLKFNSKYLHLEDILSLSYDALTIELCQYIINTYYGTTISLQEIDNVLEKLNMKKISSNYHKYANSSPYIGDDILEIIETGTIKGGEKFQVYGHYTRENLAKILWFVSEKHPNFSNYQHRIGMIDDDGLAVIYLWPPNMS